MKALTSEEVNIKIAEVDSWKVIGGSLQKEFEFVNFVKAIAVSYTHLTLQTTPYV